MPPQLAGCFLGAARVELTRGWRRTSADNWDLVHNSLHLVLKDSLQHALGLKPTAAAEWPPWVSYVLSGGGFDSSPCRTQCLLNPLYDLLPREFEYEPYTISHIVSQTQILFFSALAFVWLRRKGIYPPELKSTNLDVDWIPRRLIPGLWRATALRALNAMSRVEESVLAWAPGAAAGLVGADAGRRRPIPWATSSVVVVVTAMLAVALLLALV